MVSFPGPYTHVTKCALSGIESHVQWKMAKRQGSLFAWCRPVKEARSCETPEETDFTVDSSEDPADSGDSDTESEPNEPALDTTHDTASCSTTARCTAQCCASTEKAFQPIDKRTLSILTFNKRNFQPQWYKRFPWVSVCTTVKKVYCVYC